MKNLDSSPHWNADLNGVHEEEPRFDPNDIAIEVKQLSKKFRLASERRDSLKERFVKGRGKYDDFWALRDISLSIPRGSTFGLIGHNGSGKSTLLKMMVGIYRPTSGSIVANGRISALLELGAGFHGELTGRENIYLNGAILGLTRKQIDEAMDGIVEFAGLEEFIDAPVKVYSSGMYVRLGFSIAVTVEPEILIVDEIIAVGDEEFQRKCFDHLYELRRKGTTIVIVTHSMPIVADLCDGVAWLDKGRLMQVGPARAVIDSYLSAVNLKEAEAQGGDAEIDTEDDPGKTRRRGTGEVRVTKLDYLDGTGTKVAFMSSGEPCTFRLHYEATEEVPNVTFGLGFLHETGANVAGPNSGYGDSALTIAKGIGHIDFDLKGLIFQPGTYEVTVAVVAQGHTYDYRDRAFELRIRAQAAVTEPGLVRMLGSWSMEVEDSGEFLVETEREIS